jgi:hypothetical protein
MAGRGSGAEEASSSFLKKRTKKLFPPGIRLSRERRMPMDEVFLLLFVHKKKNLAFNTF